MARLRIVLLLLAGLVGVGLAGAQTIAEDVLKGQNLQGIQFKSYVGPHSVIETRAAIQGIGADLGRQMKVAGATGADFGGKYTIVRLHDPTSDLLSADLFILGPNAGVDDIRNLNWIVSAYLQQVFGYSVADGDLLADFITRYNALYRGKLEAFSKAYIPSVAAQLTVETAGIALNYADWPGKTRMVIPLRDSLSKGLGGSVNTEEISNPTVVTQMAQEPGAGIDERKKLADLKEGEIVQEQKAIAKAEAAAPTAQGTTPAGPTTTPAAATTAPATAPGTAATTPAPAATTPKAASTPATTPAATTPAATTATATPTTTPAALPLDKAKEQVAARDTALQAERQSIVAAQTAQTPTPAVAEVKPASVSAFVKMAEATKTGQLLLVDPATNKVWRKSALNSIRQATAPAFGQGLLVVAGDAKAATGAVRLVILSKDDGSVLLTGTDDVSPDTPLVMNNGQVLALTKSGSGWVLGAFDTTLKAVAKGTDAVSSVTAVVVTASGILVQSSSGTLLLLDAATLKLKSKTEG